MANSDEGAIQTQTLDPARELGPKIRLAADEIEQGRRLPLHLVREMQQARVFRMAMSRAWGGPELDFLSQMRVIEALSIADASTGWCPMIGIDGGYMIAYIDQTVAREIYHRCAHGNHHCPAWEGRKNKGRLHRQRAMAVRERLPARNVADWPFRDL